WPCATSTLPATIISCLMALCDCLSFCGCAPLRDFLDAALGISLTGSLSKGPENSEFSRASRGSCQRRRRRPEGRRRWRKIRELRGFPVDLRFGHARQFLVGRLFLVQRLVEEGGNVAVAELLRPGDQRAIAGHLVMFHRLRRGDERRVEHLLVLDFAGNFVGFV